MTSKAFWIKKRESGLWREETPLFLQEAITFSDFSMGKAGWKASNYLFHWNSFRQSDSWMQDTCALEQAKASVPMEVCGAPFAWPSSALDRQYLSKHRVYHWTRKGCQQSCEDYWPATAREKGVELLAGKTWAQGKSPHKHLSNEAELPISTKPTGIKPKPFFTPPAAQGK